MRETIQFQYLDSTAAEHTGEWSGEAGSALQYAVAVLRARRLLGSPPRWIFEDQGRMFTFTQSQLEAYGAAALSDMPVGATFVVRGT